MTSPILSFRCFVAGSTLSSVIAGGNVKYHASPRYALILLLESTILLVCFFMLPAPRRVEDSHRWMTGYLVSFAAGLQNAMTTHFSGAIVRTTHVTGTLTDIGVELGAIAAGREGRQTWKLALLIIFYVGFFLGGVVGTLFAFGQPEWSLLPPASVAFFLAMAYLYFLHRLPVRPIIDTDSGQPLEDKRWLKMPELLFFFCCLFMMVIGLGVQQAHELQKENASFTWDDPNTHF